MKTHWEKHTHILYLFHKNNRFNREKKFRDVFILFYKYFLAFYDTE